MTTTDGVRATGLPTVEPSRGDTDAARLNAEQRNARDFLLSRSGAAVKILVGDRATGKTTILNQVCHELEDDAVVLRTSPGTGAAFMTGLLKSAGLNPEKLTLAVRKDLLAVFLEHQKTIDHRVVIAVDDAEELVPHDWSALARLHALPSEHRADLEVMLVGRPKLYERLRSPPDSWRRVQTRVHMLHPAGESSQRDLPTETEYLIITQYGEVIDRPALKPRMLIGRNMHNDICLKHPSVSRHHAMIADTPEGFFVADLHSKNGLVVNGKRVTSALMRNGDIILLGPYRFKVVLDRARPGNPPRSPEARLTDTATMRVRALRKHLESSLLAGIKSSAS